MLSLRDLLTGAVPGNSLNQIGLGDASDPQFNRFTYNISGSLGPSPGVNTGMSTIYAGPYSNSAPSPQQAAQPKGPAPTSFQAGPPSMLTGNTQPSYMGDYSPTHLNSGMPSYYGTNLGPQTWNPQGMQTTTPYAQSPMLKWKMMA